MNKIPELPLEQAEPKKIGNCIICGDEIYDNNFRFCTDEGIVCGPKHDCIFQYVQDSYSAEEVAAGMHIPLKL